jgi:uncharacterized protein YceK
MHVENQGFRETVTQRPFYKSSFDSSCTNIIEHETPKFSGENTYQTCKLAKVKATYWTIHIHEAHTFRQVEWTLLLEIVESFHIIERHESPLV